MSLEKQFAQSETERRAIEEKVRKIKEQQLALTEISKELASLRNLLLKDMEARRVHRKTEISVLSKLSKYLDQYV